MVQHQTSSLNEYVKCVVVGDSGVGKTCLVCAWACDTRYSLENLVKTHVSTVWAIDQYRNDKEVLERSYCEVDGTRVALYVWDTFGYHDKDRRFAYRGADVILLCFSTSNPVSLKNVKKRWLPEIRNYCPTTPIVLVGTQADLRYIYKDNAYLKSSKGLLYRTVGEKDILLPEKGRDVARDIGAPYYESSVLTRYGIEDIFINAIRAALVERRKLRFWVSQLRRIQFPLIQSPMKLPQPVLPVVGMPKMTYIDEFSYQLENQNEGDIVFVTQGVCFYAYKISLVTADTIFEDLFLTDGDRDFSKNKYEYQDDDKSNLLDHEFEGVARPNSLHPAFQRVETKIFDNLHSSGKVSQTEVTMQADIKPKAFRYILEYLNTGRIRQSIDRKLLRDIKSASQIMQLKDLLLVISNMETNEEYLNTELERTFRRNKLAKLRDIALDRKLLTDVAFEVDDGLVFGHKPLLMANCEMMFAMFSDDFMEASAEVIPFPGLNKETFHLLQEYLYTGEIPSSSSSNYIALIEVANRLCLQNLVCLAEYRIVTELLKSHQDGDDVTDDVLINLEPAQLHNATQLATWCQEFLCINFQQMYKKHRKLFETLQPENQLYLRQNQWPPVWYRKEIEHYEARIHEPSLKRKIQQKQQFTRWQQCRGVCLCFCRGSSLLDDNEVNN